MSKKSEDVVIREYMRTLGTYRPEFEPVIQILSDLKKQYDTLTLEFEASRYRYDEETAAGSKKAPIVTTLESLRKDILQYYSQLGLTPRGLKMINEAAVESKPLNPLAAALKELSLS